MNALLTMALSFVLFGAVYGPLERLFPARRQRVLRPELATDLCFFAGQYLLFGVVVAACLSACSAALANWLGLLDFKLWLEALPLWARAALAVITGDLLIYWFHRACHHYDFLWRFHAVHHSVEHLDWIAAHREHPLDGLATQLLVNLPGILLGVSFTTLGAIVVFRGMWAIFIHSNIELPLGPLRPLFGAPDLHRWHHARVARTEHNFANLAPYLDLLFGTYHRPARGADYALGLVDPWPRPWLAQLLQPFKWRRPELSAQAPAAKPCM